MAARLPELRRSRAPDGCLTTNEARASRGLYLKDFDGSRRPLNSQGSHVQNSHGIIQLVLSQWPRACWEHWKWTVPKAFCGFTNSFVQ